MRFPSRLTTLFVAVAVLFTAGHASAKKKRRLQPSGIEPRGECRPGDDCLNTMFENTFPGYKRETRRAPKKDQGQGIFGGSRTTPASNAEKVALLKLLVREDRTDFAGQGLWFWLTTITFSSDAAARRAVAHYLATADNNTGHTYGWNYALHNGKKVYVLSAGCVYSSANFKRIANKLRVALAPGKGTLEVMCFCGDGCRKGPPTIR